MPPERDRDLSLEIGHVLFIDIVGYSKLLINEQSEVLEKRRRVIHRGF
jgi:hypothetical protein